MSFNSENPKPIKQRQYGLKLSSAHKATTKERHCTPIDAEMHPKIADRTFLFFQPDFHNHVRRVTTAPTFFLKPSSGLAQNIPGVLTDQESQYSEVLFDFAYL